MTYKNLNPRHKSIRVYTEDHQRLMQLKNNNESTADLVNRILDIVVSVKHYQKPVETADPE
ncbi:MAG: hypothetical protein NWE83_03795 [Candidatus Bathyarchaeota archaeon]|nr:hypothetical protein [Candidatus Bathyarchaeota archaeon]